jgi:glucokinase
VIACRGLRTARFSRGIPILSDYLLGIDIGGTKLACALGDGQGRVLGRRRRPTPSDSSASEAVAAVTRDLRELMAEVGADGPPRRIGVLAPGPLDTRAGVILAPRNLPG